MPLPALSTSGRQKLSDFSAPPSDYVLIASIALESLSRLPDWRFRFANELIVLPFV
jgi:hypothetical protein